VCVCVCECECAYVAYLVVECLLSFSSQRFGKCALLISGQFVLVRYHCICIIFMSCA